MVEELPEQASFKDIRRALRRLPNDRRREVRRAVRDGRAVSDPRDADIAIAWASRLLRTRVPSWILPRTRPSGRRAVIWLLHLAWVVAALVGVLITISSSLSGGWRLVVLGFVVYSAVVSPVMIVQSLRALWNASRTIERNRELSSVTRP